MQFSLRSLLIVTSVVAVMLVEGLSGTRFFSSMLWALVPAALVPFWFGGNKRQRISAASSIATYLALVLTQHISTDWDLTFFPRVSFLVWKLLLVLAAWKLSEWIQRHLEGPSD